MMTQPIAVVTGAATMQYNDKRHEDMIKTQVSLTDTESEALQGMARRTGKTEEQLLHEAVERFLSHAEGDNRLLLLRQARGIWKDRSDLPELRELRAEFDKRP